jgi:ketosteroid isomerase-like protein
MWQDFRGMGSANTNVEIVKKAVDAFNRGGLASEEAVTLLDAGIVFEEPPEQPAPRVAQGLDATLEMFGAFEEAWEQHKSTTEDIQMIDEDRVLHLSVEHFRGRDGIEFDQPCGTIFTVRGGKIVRMQSFWDRETALKAAGAE